MENSKTILTNIKSSLLAAFQSNENNEINPIGLDWLVWIPYYGIFFPMEHNFKPNKIVYFDTCAASIGPMEIFKWLPK